MQKCQLLWANVHQKQFYEIELIISHLMWHTTYKVEDCELGSRLGDLFAHIFTLISPKSYRLYINFNTFIALVFSASIVTFFVKDFLGVGLVSGA